jgi:hypothetical protein
MGSAPITQIGDWAHLWSPNCITHETVSNTPNTRRFLGGYALASSVAATGRVPARFAPRRFAWG